VNNASIHPADRVRQTVVIVVAVVAIISAAVGSGAFGGTPIQEAAGGALAADATRIAPAVPAFAIWSMIYLGLAAFAVWQALPAQTASPRLRRLGYWVAASLALNAAWILSVQAGWLLASVVVIVLLLAVLAFSFLVCADTRSSGWVETVLVDGVIGLYLGWVCVATAANITAVLVAAGFTGGPSADVWAVIVLLMAGAVGAALAWRSFGRLAPALSLCWGLVWVAVARLTGEPHSVAAAVAALVAVGAVAVVTISFRVMGRPPVPA